MRNFWILDSPPEFIFFKKGLLTKKMDHLPDMCGRLRGLEASKATDRLVSWDKLNFILLFIFEKYSKFFFITIVSKSSQIVYKQYKNGFWKEKKIWENPFNLHQDPHSL